MAKITKPLATDETLQAIQEAIIKQNSILSDFTGKGDLKLHDERIKYYGDADVVPSPEELFIFTTDDTTMTTSIKLNHELITSQGVEEIVIPYEYVDGDKSYLVTSINDQELMSDYSPRKANNTVVSVIIPNTLTEIGRAAFYNYIKLLNITIPYGVVKIGSYAFGQCHELKKLVMPDSVISVGDKAFTECIHLNKITLSNNLTSIGDSVFFSCTQIFDVTIPSSVIQMGAGVFEKCSSQLVVHCYEGAVSEALQSVSISCDVLNSSIITSISYSNIRLSYGKEIRLGILNGIHHLYIVGVKSNTYESHLCFTTGTTFSLSYTGSPIVWKGDDVDDEGDFVPNTNTMYEITFKKINERTLDDGTVEPVIVARVSVI